jgi:hypothetical protein
MKTVMKTNLKSTFAIFALTIGMLSLGHAKEADHPNHQHPIDLPPSAQLHYTIKADHSGLSLSGEASVNWQLTGDKSNPGYTISTETRAAIFGKILDAGSHGVIDSYGLAPLQYDDKPRNKNPFQARFDRNAKQISFATSDDTYPILGGEQDRSSIVWQLVSIARAAPKKFVPGSTWEFFVAGRHDAEKWTFAVEERVTLTTPLGNIETVHLVKAPPPDSKDQRLDLWLAPGKEWYPVRLKFSDADGDTVDQRIDQITPAGSTSNPGNQP